MKFWLKTAALIGGVWILAAIIIHFASASQPTAASVAAYIRTADLDTLQGGARARAIDRMEQMVNRLPFDERQQLDRKGVNRDFFHKLTPAEQGAYLDATLPTGFQQLMDAFNKMDPLRRKQIVNDALARMKEREGQGPPLGADPNLAQHVIDQGLKSFYSDANADVKLDLAPLIEQMQRNLQHP
jgi:hypothetical protein